MVTKWIGGEHKSYWTIDRVDWMLLGSQLADLHLRLRDFDEVPLHSLGDELGHLRSKEALAKIKEQRSALSALGASAAVLEYQEARLKLLFAHGTKCFSQWPTEDHAQAIHNDYNVNNYLFHGDASPTIIDWDRAISAPPAYEVVRCLNHLPLEAPESARAFVEGYRSLAPLDAESVVWAVDAAMVSHGGKQWPVDLALQREVGALERLASLAPIVRALADAGEDMKGFYQTILAN